MKSWKKHAIAITVYILVSTPLTVWAYTLSPLAQAIIESITNTSNLIALFYAVYIYRLYDEAKM